MPTCPGHRAGLNASQAGCMACVKLLTRWNKERNKQRCQKPNMPISVESVPATFCDALATFCDAWRALLWFLSPYSGARSTLEPSEESSAVPAH